MEKGRLGWQLTLYSLEGPLPLSACGTGSCYLPSAASVLSSVKWGTDDVPASSAHCPTMR